MSKEPVRWWESLNEEDLAFVRRFVLASGSLKELAQAYGVSYPTVRLRLDRLIEKIKVIEAAEQVSEFEKALRAAFAGGEIDSATMKRLRQAHEKALAKAGRGGSE